jgi:hypothetical protein
MCPRSLAAINALFLLHRFPPFACQNSGATELHLKFHILLVILGSLLKTCWLEI